MNGHVDLGNNGPRLPLSGGGPMFTRADVDKLLGIDAPGLSLLSLYLRVPQDPAQLRELPARADGLLGKPAGDGTAGAGHGADAAGRSCPRLARPHHRNLCLRGTRPGRGDPAARPAAGAGCYRRPAACPALCCWPSSGPRRTASSWPTSGTGGCCVSPVTRSMPLSCRTPKGCPAAASAAYGLEAYRINDRVVELTRRHYRDTVAALEQGLRADRPEPLVIGGHEETIPQAARRLPAHAARAVAGRSSPTCTP